MLHFMLALEEFYDIRDWNGKLCCDNQSALYQASRGLVRIRPSAKGADILCNMRTIKRQLTARLNFEHVDGHMDRILLWHQLSRENHEVRLLPSGPKLVQKDPTMSGDFSDHLGSLGGEWMFENVGTDDTWKREDLRWITEGMERGTLTWVADGSYDRKRAPRISGAGWVVHCSATGKILRSFFYQKSTAASS